MVLLVGVVDVIVLFMPFVLPGMVVGDGPGDVESAGGDTDGEAVRVRVAVLGVGGRPRIL